ncbi:MAG: CsiV family protein [Vibrio sp.]
MKKLILPILVSLAFSAFAQAETAPTDLDNLGQESAASSQQIPTEEATLPAEDTSQALAQAYNVEVIVFRRNIQPSEISEQLEKNPAPLDFSRAVAITDNNIMSTKDATLLPESSYEMNQQYQALQDHAGFTPLLHLAWTQNTQDETNAPEFRIQAGQDFSTQFSADGKELDKTATAQTKNTDTTAVDTGSLLPKPEAMNELDGIMQFYQQDGKTFLKAQLNLRVVETKETVLKESDTEKALDEQAAEDDNEAAVQIGHLEPIQPKVQVERFLETYRMDQAQQVDSTDLYYLDNPLIGVLVKVTASSAPQQSSSPQQQPAQQPAEPASEAEPNAATDSTATDANQAVNQ